MSFLVMMFSSSELEEIENYDLMLFYSSWLSLSLNLPELVFSWNRYSMFFFLSLFAKYYNQKIPTPNPIKKNINKIIALIENMSYNKKKKVSYLNCFTYSSLSPLLFLLKNYS